MTTKPGKISPSDALLEQAFGFIAEAPEEQFLQYLKETGENPRELSKMTADAVASAIKAFGQSQLAAARAEQERRLASIEALRARISTYDGNVRTAFSHMVSEAENGGYKVSLQHRLRQLDDLSDEEIKAMMLELFVVLQSKKDENKP
jgi:hypothetical protein